MPTDAPSPSAVVWLDPEQTDLVRTVAERVGLSVVGAGSSQVGRSRDVAAALGAAPLDDLRSALTSADASVFLLAAPGDFGAAAEGGGSTDDAGVLAACRSRGVRVVSLEPMPASVLQLEPPSLLPPLVEGLATGADAIPATQAGGPGDWAAFCPLARLSRPMREAAEVLAQLGAIHTVLVECWGGPVHGSLGARVFDAVELVVSLLGQPETVDAAYVWPARSRPVHQVPGESLRGVSGSMTVNMRFADGRAAAIAASDRAGRWDRAVTVLGESGRVRIDDGGFEWIGADGRLVDASRRPPSPEGDPAADPVSEQLGRLLDPRIPPAPPTDYVRVLAAAGAALLSARTGEAESPDTILRMARSG